MIILKILPVILGVILFLQSVKTSSYVKNDAEIKRKPRIVVIGCGFAGLELSKKLYQDLNNYIFFLKNVSFSEKFSFN